MSANTPMSNIPPLGPPTGMMPGGGPSKFKPIDPVRVLRANWLWISLGLFFGVFVGTGGWYALNKYQAKYTSEAQFNVQASNVNLNEASIGLAGLESMNILEPLILREVQRIKSEPILRQILQKDAVQQTTWFTQFDNNFDDAFENLDEEVLRATHIRETPLFLIRATTKDKEDSQAILRALEEEYIRITTLEKTSDSDQSLRAAQGRLDSTVQRINNITVQIKRFLEANPLDAINGGSSEAELRVRALIVKQEELNQAFSASQASYNLLLERQAQNQFDPSDEDIAIIEAGRDVAQIDSILLTLRVQRNELATKLGEGHAAVLSLDRQILGYERERQTEFDAQARIIFNAKLEGAANTTQLLAAEVQKINQAVAEWNARRQDYVRLLQEYETLNRSLEQAEREREEVTSLIDQLIAFNTGEGRTTVEVYVPPQKAQKTFPPEPYIMIPGVSILMMGLVTGLVFLRELVDQRVRSAQDVKMIPDATLIGMIPSVSQDRGTKNIERVVENQPSGLLSESFRQARTAVLSKIDRRGYKTLMMVSAKPGAGVTSCAQNLAASCARSGRRVLMIDANFRRPGLAKLMSLSGQPGLAEILAGNQAMGEVGSMIQASSLDGLSVLAAGDASRAAVELFESPRFRDLLAKLEAEYDLIIIDAPPAFLTSDAQLLSRHIDAMVLVSRSQSDTRGILQRLHNELDGQRADILGVLLNGVEASVGGYMKRNFREFHEYSGPERRKADRAAMPRSNGAAKRDRASSLNGGDETQRVFEEMDIQASEEQDR